MVEGNRNSLTIDEIRGWKNEGKKEELNKEKRRSCALEGVSQASPH